MGNYQKVVYTLYAIEYSLSMTMHHP